MASFPEPPSQSSKVIQANVTKFHAHCKSWRFVHWIAFLLPLCMTLSLSCWPLLASLQFLDLLVRLGYVLVKGDLLKSKIWKTASWLDSVHCKVQSSLSNWDLLSFLSLESPLITKTKSDSYRFVVSTCSGQWWEEKAWVLLSLRQ